MRKHSFCTFCGKQADTREHVFARCFFDKPHPSNMFTVPSCHKCNQSFSSDEQYLMYLIDYLKSIESNDGDFTRNKAKSTFIHNDNLEDRMINSIQVFNRDTVFVLESERIERVVKKTAKCLYRYCFNQILPYDRIECNWAFASQLSEEQLRRIATIPFVPLQANTVKYYYSHEEIGYCLSEFFYAVVRVSHSKTASPL